MRKRSLKDKRAVSTVIATVIIVAVTIAIAIAVAYWIGGLSSLFTRFEKIEIKSMYATKSGGAYTVTVNFINTGATQTGLDSVMLNGEPADSWGATGTAALDWAAASKPTYLTGVDQTGTITFSDPATDDAGNELTAGVTLTVDIHSTGGKDYYASVVLP